MHEETRKSCVCVHQAETATRERQERVKRERDKRETRERKGLSTHSLQCT